MTKAARFPGSAGPVVRSSFAALTAIVLALACLFGFQQSAFSAVALDGIAQDRGAALLSAPLGVAADSLGNFYVVDPGKYHVIKFDASGIPKKIIGKQGFGNGQLYYPQGVAVGLHSNGDTLLYVADTGNSRVVVFDDEGHYVGKFGDVTPAGALLNPGGIAYLKNRSTPGGLVLVADTRNHRIMLFKENGAFQKEYRCPTCPAGGIRPLGVSARLTRDGTLQIVASDELTGQVQVINNGGGWVRSIGRKGAGKGELRAPDDVAVDEDGNVWVADPAFGLEQISKFGPDGTFRYAFNTTGSTAFTQPHGVAIDEQGKIYVAESAAAHTDFARRRQS